MQETKQLPVKVDLKKISVLLTSAVIIAVNIAACPVQAKAKSHMDKLSDQLEVAVSTHSWRKSISIVDNMFKLIPSSDYEQRIRLKSYRAQLRLLYDYKIEPHFYPPVVVHNFIKGCVTRGGKQMKPICTCFIDKLSDKYTLEQFAQLELKFVKKAPMPDYAARDFRNIGASCRLANN